MASKQIVNRKRSATSVIECGKTNAPLIAAALQARLSPHLGVLGGQPFPDVTGLILLCIAELQARLAAMLTAEEAHEAELRDDPAYRDRRDSEAARLYSMIVDLRGLLESLYGAPVAKSVGLSGTIPQDPTTLSRVAGEVSAALKTITLPAPRLRGASLDPAEQLTDIDQSRTDLEASFQDVAREQREAQLTLATRNQRTAEYDEAFAQVANLLVALLELAGMYELAPKVRPSTRRPGQTEVEPAEEVSPTPTPSAT